ncbi:MAG TPA: sigma-70 family RNA polymerase sigma factor [Tepidisphaeraceae bacterium]|nr:sigma-70 family RNA polymerase sigma factor [Tepidisphaeraceae bacterium]
MKVQDDLELLRQFSRERSDAAFAQLVRRHVNLVYSAALRQLHDPATAEDVTQTVFMALASKAAGIGPKTIVPGWLLLTTRYAAKDALRAERRRRRHERSAALQRAAEMRNMEESSSSADAVMTRDEQSRLEAVLDGVLAKLGTAGRDAIVLRFFEGNSLSEVGRRLGISEDAAKKRVSRSLAQMRALLLPHGITLGSEGIGSMLGAIAVRPAPSALAARASHAAVAGASVSMAKGVITIMAWTKAKTTAVATVALLLIGGGATVSWHMMYGRSGRRVIVLPPGQIAPGTNFTWQNPLGPAGNHVYHGPPIVGTVRTTDGKPVAGATVKLATWDADVILDASPRAKPVPTTRTGPDGRFEFRPTSMPYGLLATSDQGIGFLKVATLASASDLVIQPWGHVEGTARLGSKPLRSSHVLLWYQNSAEANAARIDYNGYPRISVSDESGHFVFDHIPPGVADITCRLPGTLRAQHSPRFHIQSGTTTTIVAGGTGRPVIGRVSPPPREGNSHSVRLERERPEPFAKLDWDRLAPEQRAQRKAELEAWERDCNPFNAEIGADGSFRLEDVPAGTYMMRVAYSNFSRESRYIETIGELDRKLTIAPMPDRRSDVPMDLGTIDLPLRKRLAIGQPAPELTWRDIDGNQSSLQSFRGKYVLGIVLPSANESDDMWEDLLKLKPVYDRFGSDQRLTMLALYVGNGFDAARQSAAHDGVTWPFVDAGKSLDSVPEPYRSSGEMMFVIDPQGAVLAKDLAPQRAWYVLDQALSRGGMPGGPAQVSVQHLGAGDDLHNLLQSAGANAAAHGIFTIVDGIPAKSPPLVLVSGSFPDSDDAPTQNFCFEGGTLEGRLKLDLGETKEIRQIMTVSRHKSDRAPQVYTLYVSDGASPDFDPAPKIGIDPTKHGWMRWASVDSRPTQPAPWGGTYAVTLLPAARDLPKCRYLLFEMFPTETVDPFGHTFYSQIIVNGVKADNSHE